MAKGIPGFVVPFGSMFFIYIYAKKFKELSDKGCYCMLTNHDTPLIRELYKDYNIKVIDVRRSINRNGNDRKGKEVIITNY